MAKKRRKRQMTQQAKTRSHTLPPSKQDTGKRPQRPWKSLVMPTVAAVTICLLAFGSAAYIQATGRGKESSQKLNQIITLDLLETFPHDTSAFTQGLLYHEGFLYESAGGWGQSSLRQVNITTGQIVRRRNLEARYFAEGLERVGDKLYQLTWKSRVGFVYDLHTFELLRTFKLHTTTNDGWGIAYDGSNFLITDGSEYLHVTEPKSMSLVRRIRVTLPNGKPLKNLNELEFIGNQQVLANIWFNNLVARIDLNTGRVIRWYNFTEYSLHTGGEDVLNGLAYAPEEKVLYATGKMWKAMYKMKFF